VPAPDRQPSANDWPSSHVGRDAIDADVLLALTALGFTKREAVHAVEWARECLDDNADLESAGRAALQHCPPSGG
jgi:Holliday junction resolvasome RuvABC DNA-binding subunit